MSELFEFCWKNSAKRIRRDISPLHPRRNESPLDDIGSTSGYEEFIEMVNSPDHEEQKEMAEWYGDNFFGTEEVGYSKIFFVNPDMPLRQRLHN